MSQDILNALPEDLAFLASAVRRMLIVHEANQPPFGADMEPEQARDVELAASFEQDREILGEALREHFDVSNRAFFVEEVRAVQSRLLTWLGPHKRGPLTGETDLLFGIVGMLANPEGYFVRSRSRKKGR